MKDNVTSVEQKQYQVYFDFTTIHGNRFVGRSGSCYFETENNMLDVLKDVDEIQKLCVGFVLSQKPKWNILMLTITNVEQL